MIHKRSIKKTPALAKEKDMYRVGSTARIVAKAPSTGSCGETETPEILISRRKLKIKFNKWVTKKLKK